MESSVERRDVSRRVNVIRPVVEHLRQNLPPTITIDGLSAALDVPTEAAQRIYNRLVSSGVIRVSQAAALPRGGSSLRPYIVRRFPA